MRKNDGVYTPKQLYELAKQQLSQYKGKNQTAMIGVLPKECKGKWLNGKTFKIDDLEDRGLTIMPSKSDSDEILWEKEEILRYMFG